MKTFRSDLHVHTVLSPCAEVEMIPPLIVREALERKIDIIAVTDHNASANVCAVQKAAEGTGLTVLPGMEVQSREDVHLLCLFASLSDLEAWQHDVDISLPETKNNADLFGGQFVVDESGEFIRSEERMLLISTKFSIEEIIQRVNELGGLVVPAHVDRTSFGLFPTLGFLADWWNFPALEISRHITPDGLYEKFPSSIGHPLIQSGDAHRLDEFLGATLFEIEAPSLSEIRMAFLGENGRKVCLERK
ncbi:MAG TPA: PHP domain-containing protein [Anaerolineales bacterium]|nr:PHP domain-containing protein [Anaerolineales bacterium]